MVFYAHSTERTDKSDWEPLLDHLYGVARTAEAAGNAIGIGHSARLAGLLHDLGKYQGAFQRRLEGAGEPVDHSIAGAVTLLDAAEAGGNVDDLAFAQLVAQAIAGHHAGLADRTNADASGASTLASRLEGWDRDALDAQWRRDVRFDTAGLNPGFAWTPERAGTQLALLGRMILSCLVDADRQETERFYAGIGGPPSPPGWPVLEDVLPAARATFDTRIAEFGAPATPLATLRAEVLTHVRERAALSPGLFTLHVPTGGGKTLAALGFALDHAARHGHRRVITAIPFTSIVDQTAAIYGELLGDDLVLEHHSGFDQRSGASREADTRLSGRDKLRLAVENWGAPFVVTTHVQLFESLFAARTTPCRKLHSIAHSVIVLDEAQTLPKHLLAPTVATIDALARHWGCTVVLCTATQPAFDARHYREGHPLGLELEGRELAPDPERLAHELTRTRLVDGGTMDDRALVGALADHPRALVIVNSRTHALQLYRAATDAGLDGLVHLTTRQCGADRKRIIADVKKRLDAGVPCRVIATSLVEAGVDLDFPRVWRAEAGLDQLVQAAGRCNREGKARPGDSIVTVFRAPEHAPPREIAPHVEAMRHVLASHADPFAPGAMDRYFEEVYWQAGEEYLDGKRTRSDQTFTSLARLDPDDPAVPLKVQYRTIAERYRMIESGMVPVIVPADDRARAVIARIGVESVPSGAFARAFQPYTVEVPPRARDRLMAAGHVRFHAEALRADQFAVLESPERYTRETGLVWEDPEYLSVEALMF